MRSFDTSRNVVAATYRVRAAAASQVWVRPSIEDSLDGLVRGAVSGYRRFNPTYRPTGDDARARAPSLKVTEALLVHQRQNASASAIMPS